MRKVLEEITSLKRDLRGRELGTSKVLEGFKRDLLGSGTWEILNRIEKVALEEENTRMSQSSCDGCVLTESSVCAECVRSAKKDLYQSKDDGIEATTVACVKFKTDSWCYADPKAMCGESPCQLPLPTKNHPDCKMRHVNQVLNRDGVLQCKDCRKVFSKERF
jgi:hypothetical protein